MFASNVQFGYPCPRGGGGKLSRLVYLAPCPGFGSGSVISQFLLHHYLGIFSCKRYKHYFSQTEMLTSNVQLGYPCQRGGGQAVQAGLSCPPPPTQDLSQALSSVQFLLHHNLGKFSCKSCEHYFSQTEMFTSNVQFGYPCPRGGGQAVQAGLSCPPPRILSSVNSNCIITLEYLVVSVVNIISVKLRCLHLAVSSVILVRGVGGKLSRLVYWNYGRGAR